MTDPSLNRDLLQRRTVRVLQMGVVPGGLAMGTSYSVAALLGSEITGSDTLGALAAVGLSIGQSLSGIPIAGLMARRGRRIGIGTAYLVGSIGASCSLLAALTEIYVLLVIGMTLCGCGQAGNLAARYAGSDLATDDNRARSIVWLSGLTRSARFWDQLWA